MLLFSTLLLAVLINAVLTSAICHLVRWVWVSGRMLVSAASLAVRKLTFCTPQLTLAELSVSLCSVVMY